MGHRWYRLHYASARLADFEHYLPSRLPQLCSLSLPFLAPTGCMRIYAMGHMMQTDSCSLPQMSQWLIGTIPQATSQSLQVYAHRCHSDWLGRYHKRHLNLWVYAHRWVNATAVWGVNFSQFSFFIKIVLETLLFFITIHIVTETQYVLFLFSLEIYYETFSHS